MDKKPTNSGVAESALARPGSGKSPLFWTAILLVLILAVIFWRCFNPAYVIFSNDGPYGGMVAELNRMPSILWGIWANSNWFGNESLSPPLSVSTLLRLLTTPLIYAKALCPVSLFIVGIGACFCFRQLRLAPVACILGGLAATLNSDFFSTACWGVATQVIGFGFMYLAIGLIAKPSVKRRWIRIVLAGFAVGIGVMEAYDIGALFSLFVAAFVVYHALFLSEDSSPLANKAAKGILRTAVVAGFAAFIAIHTMLNLVGTQIQGISGMSQDKEVKAAHWTEATFFSVPKAETLQVLVPGIFGFRDKWYMYEYDEPTEEQYWGSIGAMPGLAHLIGTGFYAGVPVVLLAIWAVVQSFRREESPFSILQRRAIWFWSGVTLISLLFAYGKHAPFYQLFYALPYASTIRNPAKFMHVFSWALVILFAYGAHGLATLYLQNYVSRASGVLAQFKGWLAKATSFERKWLIGCLIAVGVSLVAWMIYATSNSNLVAYLQTVGVSADEAPGVARFSLMAVGWYVFLLVVTVLLLALIFSGQFSGSRGKWGGILLGALLIFDLGRADVPWLVYWDLDYKYADDPIIDFLGEKPYEHRVAVLPAMNSAQMSMLQNQYGNDWKQHLFLSKNIQCADVVQEPRVAVDKAQFMDALNYTDPSDPLRIFKLFRFWELSNTRYLLGPNTTNLPPQFHVLKTFNFVPKRPNPSQWGADYKTELDPKGELAVIDFTTALPRAKLYSNWQVNTNEQSTLQTLASPEFDVHQNVLVATNIPAPTSPKADPGTVEINPNYKSKRIELEADVKVPSVLLLSERYNPKWKVEVDGKPAPLLRCNFIERGVYLTPGKHEVVMRFVTSMDTLCISLAAVILGLGLWGFLIISPTKEEAEPSTKEKESVPAKEKSAAK